GVDVVSKRRVGVGVVDLIAFPGYINGGAIRTDRERACGVKAMRHTIVGGCPFLAAAERVITYCTKIVRCVPIPDFTGNDEVSAIRSDAYGPCIVTAAAGNRCPIII